MNDKKGKIAVVLLAAAVFVALVAWSFRPTNGQYAQALETYKACKEAEKSAVLEFKDRGEKLAEAKVRTAEALVEVLKYQ